MGKVVTYSSKKFYNIGPWLTYVKYEKRLVNEVTVGQMTWSVSTKYCIGKMSVGKMSVGKMPVGKMPVGKMSVGKMSVG